MCGVVGMVGVSASDAVVRRMLPAVRHRGPDGEGVWSGAGVALGHTRLAIIDPDPRSAQPMRRGKLVVVYNGEIWNYRAVRDELRAHGHRFRTTSDTEVLLAAWEQWGPDCLMRLDGMFAFALWDGELLWAVKDKWGKCPLAIGTSLGFVAFASEQRALRDAGVQLAGFEELRPGSLKAWHPRSTTPVEDRAWWTFTPKPLWPERALPFWMTAAKVVRLLEEGVKARTIADVPVCTLLSGGIDSLAIAFFAKRHMGKITAYTAKYQETSPDLHAARENARLLDIPLIEVPVEVPPTAAALRECIGEAIEAADIFAPAQVEIAVACRALAERISADGFKVVFSGEGSDELWGSYKPVRILRGKPDAWQAARRQQIVNQWRKNFPRCNKVFLSAGVECRLPFLHLPLVEFGIRLPVPIVEYEGRLKGVLVEGLAHELEQAGIDPAIARRPRVAFQVGLGLRDTVRRMIPDRIAVYRREHRQRVWKEDRYGQHGTAATDRRRAGSAAGNSGDGLRDDQPIEASPPRGRSAVLRQRVPHHQRQLAELLSVGRVGDAAQPARANRRRGRRQ